MTDVCISAHGQTTEYLDSTVTGYQPSAVSKFMEASMRDLGARELERSNACNSQLLVTPESKAAERILKWDSVFLKEAAADLHSELDELGKIVLRHIMRASATNPKPSCNHLSDNSFENFSP